MLFPMSILTACVVFVAIYQSTKANGGLLTLNQLRVSSGAVAHWTSAAQQVFCIKQYVKRFIFCLLSLETVGKVLFSVKLRNCSWGQGQRDCSFLDMGSIRARWGQARVGKSESRHRCFRERKQKSSWNRLSPAMLLWDQEEARL